MASADSQVVVIGGGVVGCAVAHALARRGVEALLLEAEAELALGASGANSGILHTGFDSSPGELETRLILRSAALREQLLDELAVPVWRCGARLAPTDADERAAVARLADNARANGVETRLTPDGALRVPGEALTDPVAFVLALAGAARVGGATVLVDARVSALDSAGEDGLEITLADGRRVRANAAINCAGLHADEVACMAGEQIVEVYPRKGEFIVFRAPVQEPLEQILLPVPSAISKGVLVFPTLDGRAIIAGPTAREREDKRDRSVGADARELILLRAARMWPALEGLQALGAYAGLRPAGRGANYVIEHSRTLPGLIHVAAIRSTGLSASLGIGEHVARMLAETGVVSLGHVRRLPAPAAAPATTTTSPSQPPPASWWERAISLSQQT